MTSSKAAAVTTTPTTPLTTSPSEEEECPLCLSPLQNYDIQHPLQCPSTHCSFNFCLACIEALIASTKDDQVSEASDGNAFRVFLHCPNCRSNLGPSIRDTMLLRKVDKYTNGNNAVDEELSASELRLKYALEKDEDVASAIQAARLREREFFGCGVELDLDSLDIGKVGSTSSSWSTNLWSFDDEEGVEADLENGVHKSFIYRHHTMDEDDYDRSCSGGAGAGGGNLTQQNAQKSLLDVVPDTTLLFGLDFFMTEEEQKFLTSLLTSGEPAKLAAATEMMHHISTLSQQGIPPSLKRRQSSRNAAALAGRQRSQRDFTRSMLSSIREVIKEGNEARKAEHEKGSRQVAGVMAKKLKHDGLAGKKREQKRQNDLEMRKQMEHMRFHPLPVRMPKYAELRACPSDVFALQFLDDVWNGTVMDAFTKITVSTRLLGNVTVSKTHAESLGIQNVIQGGSNPKYPNNKNGVIDVERPRVIVASMTREGGHQGIVKGDVITHCNGDEFMGSARDLRAFIDSRQEGEILTFAFNADKAVAEALRRRSLIKC
mmetsp:Transcript_15916/g.32220  ORF Transcript_15916/g.32220 Transcript_15916/m.32220 type:complete len:545 (+) Transcript_15916:166-1800(+)